MQIKEAIIGQFGKLQNRNISFEPGINVIYGENEAGKTTLHDFLLGMFFGMEKGRGRGTLNSMYQKHAQAVCRFKSFFPSLLQQFCFHRY